MLIDVIAGARPNFMKIAPIIDAIETQQQQQSSPGACTGSTTALSPDMLDNIDNYLITTEIN